MTVQDGAWQTATLATDPIRQQTFLEEWLTQHPFRFMPSGQTMAVSLRNISSRLAKNWVLRSFVTPSDIQPQTVRWKECTGQLRRNASGGYMPNPMISTMPGIGSPVTLLGTIPKDATEAMAWSAGHHSKG